MALIHPTPTYFLAPNCDFPPDGLIFLGSIIANPKTPQKSLNHQCGQRVAVPVDDLQESFKNNWEHVIQSSGHKKVSLWASFVQMILGLGADVGIGLTQGSKYIYKFRQLETKYFEPNESYIEGSLKVEGVMAYISATRHQKPIYMVTGVKIARGASVTNKTVKEYGVKLKAGFDATMLTGTPVSGGPEFETNATKDRDVKFEGSSDYVFAYRLVKIHLTKDGSVKRHKDFIKGALFSTEEETSNKNLVTGNWRVEELVSTSKELQGNDIVSEVYEDGEDSVVIFVKP